MEDIGTTLEVTFEELWRPYPGSGRTAQGAFRVQGMDPEHHDKPVITCAPDTHIHDAAHLMLEKDIHCLPVVENEGTLEGIVTESDLIVPTLSRGRRQPGPPPARESTGPATPQARS